MYKRQRTQKVPLNVFLSFFSCNKFSSIQIKIFKLIIFRHVLIIYFKRIKLILRKRINDIKIYILRDTIQHLSDRFFFTNNNRITKVLK